MHLIINGEKRDVAGVSSVVDLLVSFKLQQKILVVELNRNIVDRDRYGGTLLKEGDHLEIVHFVGGG